MFTFLLASRRSIAAIIATIVIVDIVVGTALIAADLDDCRILPKGVGFGFYKTDETKG